MEEVVKDYYNNNNVTKLCTNHLNWSRSKWISTRLPRDSSSLFWIDPQLKFVEIEARLVSYSFHTKPVSVNIN